jgi:golgi-specific brefeldin A-resistance guanine nucleotide exchange factor 1
VLLLPLPEILDPFLALIRSPLSTGPITSAALSSLSSFLESGLISLTSVDLKPALSDLSNALAKCKFEANDVSSDEVVTLRILNLIRDCILKDVGSMLGNFEICEMIEPVLTTCCQLRLSGGESLARPRIQLTEPYRDSKALCFRYHACGVEEDFLPTQST